MNAIKSLSTNMLNFTKKNYLWVILVILFLVIVVSLSSKEGFEDFNNKWETLAEYPATFVEKVSTPFLKENTFINYYLPSKKATGPMSVDSQHLELKDGQAKVPIDIGNGLAVEAVVQIQKQTVDVEAQNTVQVPKHTSTDVTVEQQEIHIPKQTSIIPGKMTEDGEMIALPVTVEAQTVTVEKQSAIIPSFEAFRSTY